MRRILLLGLAVAVAACGPTKANTTIDANGTNPDGNGLPHKLQAIVVTPGDTLMELDVNTSAAQAFTATGNFLDGIPEDLTGQVTWASSNLMVGSIAGSTLSIPGFAVATAETTKISATLDGFEGDAQLTVAAYRKSGTTQDFFFVLPYVDPVGQVVKPLDFSTVVPALDVFFLMDTTGSMIGEIHNLQTALTNTVTGIQTAAATTQFGVGAMEDFPISPYGFTNPAASCPSVTGGSNPDQPLVLLQSITSNLTDVSTAVAALSPGGKTLGCGNDTPEGDVEALYQLATHEGFVASPINIPATPAGFHATSMPVIVDITDAKFHNGVQNTCEVDYTISGAHTNTQAKTAINNICGHVVGVAAVGTTINACDGFADLTDFATATGSRVPPAAWDIGTRPTGCSAGQCCTGKSSVGVAPDVDGLCPLVFQAALDGTGVSSGIVTGIQMLARFATFDVNTERDGVTTDVDGNPLGAGHTTADFLKAITPDHFMKAAPPPVLPDPTFDTVAFHKVTPGTQVFFNVSAFNDFVMETDSAQIFRATIKVLAGGCTALDQRDVLILVPPKPLVIQ